MKKKTTEPAKDPIAEYRRLLTVCVVQFARLSDYFANNPSATLPDKNRTIALRLVRDTTQAGDAARLSIAATNAGLAEELRDKQADLKSEMVRLLAKMDCPSAALLAATAEIVQASLDSITELLSGGKRPRYPKDADALKVLREAAKRKKRDEYRDATNEYIARSLLLQENTDAYWRIMLRPKTKGVSAPPRLPKYNRFTPCVKQAAKNWGGYISAYLIDHKDA